MGKWERCDSNTEYINIGQKKTRDKPKKSKRIVEIERDRERNGEVGFFCQ